MRTFLILAAALHAGAALAQYECTSPGGGVSFQDVPCAAGQKSRELDLAPRPARPASGASAAVAASAPRPRSAVRASHPVASAASRPLSVDQRMLAEYARQDRLQQLQDAVDAVRKEMAGHEQQRAADLAAVRAASRRASADGVPLDPADTAASVRSINARYDAMAQLDRSRLEAAQEKLAAAGKEVGR